MGVVAREGGGECPETGRVGDAHPWWEIPGQRWWPHVCTMPILGGPAALDSIRRDGLQLLAHWPEEGVHWNRGLWQRPCSVAGVTGRDPLDGLATGGALAGGCNLDIGDNEVSVRAWPCGHPPSQR